MRKDSRRLAIGGAIAGISMLASVFVGPSPAQAYDDTKLRYDTERVNTYTCEPLQPTQSTWVKRNGYCYGPDGLDGTWFVPDKGGIGYRVIVRNAAGQMLAKVEWHPYGEHLWVYDTKNDGDTIWVHLNPADDWAGVLVRPPGTSAVIDYKDYNLDYPEGLRMEVILYDQSDRRDFMLGSGSNKITA